MRSLLGSVSAVRSPAPSEPTTTGPDVTAGTRETIGIVKKNVEPRPSVLSTQIRPPCASTRPFAMDNPRPVPCLAVFFACQ